MTALKTGLLWLLCAIDTALGAWHAQALVNATRTSGASQTVTPENADYILFTSLLLMMPVLCWLLRARSSLTVRLVLAALPLALFVALGGSVWVRWK
jgi:hypothetical protein